VSRTRYFSQSLTAAIAALGLMGAVLSPSHAQPPPLGTTANFGILAGTGITNTGPSIITGTAAHPGDLGSSTATIGGFPPGIVTPPGVIHAINDGPTITAKSSLTTAYNNLAGKPTTTDLTGQNLGGLTLVPGVYNFSSSAQLTGGLTLNGLGNPNSVFIFKIGSTLTTASASTVSLINGAQGSNVFWKVGSSATLGTATSFAGDILALTSITLNTSAKITCGAAWAQNGAVTLDTNTISLCDLLAGPGPGPGPGPGVPDLGPTGVPLFTSLLLSSANQNERALANALDTFSSNGGMLPLAFVNLFNLAPSQLADAFSQLQGEAATGAPQAGTQAMNSFLSLVTNPFGDNRSFAPESPQSPRSPLIYKAPVSKASAAAEPDPRRWGIWAAAYGGQNNTTGDALAGSHDRSARTFGIATGFDYRVTPYTVVGFALAGGGTNYGLSDGFGGGRSDMFQAAVYSSTRVNAAYVSAAVAYAWHRVSTDRFVTVAGTDHLTADFSANNVGGRIEGGYRFAIPNVIGWPGQYGVTPYAAGQMQVFRTPSYSESAASGSAIFALGYNASTTTTTRTELGVRSDWTIPVDYRTTLTLRTRAAWAHDYWSDPSITVAFLSLPGSSFTVTGAAPAKDLLLASSGAEISFRNGFSLAAWFDGEFADQSRKYGGTARLRYIW
jgi:outer membrane autotransporter protein